MKLRQLIELGIFSLDDDVHWQWCDDAGEPSIDDPVEVAEENMLQVGDTFELLEGMYLAKPRIYRVVSAPDLNDDDDETEYEVERTGAGER